MKESGWWGQKMTLVAWSWCSFLTLCPKRRRCFFITQWLRLENGYYSGRHWFGDNEKKERGRLWAIFDQRFSNSIPLYLVPEYKGDWHHSKSNYTCDRLPVSQRLLRTTDVILLWVVIQHLEGYLKFLLWVAVGCWWWGKSAIFRGIISWCLKIRVGRADAPGNMPLIIGLIIA
jgi:hypothetical protein